MKRAFGERLRRAFAAEREEGQQSLRDALRRREARLSQDPIELPPGQIVENDRGACFVRQLRYPLDVKHGDMSLGAAWRADRERLAVLAKMPDVATLDLSKCLFLDTETTGLSGGAGTIVFMVGLGFFDGAEFVLEQTFLRSYGDEPAALIHTASRLEQYPNLVTFVGKCFDRHRIAARMAVHRIRSRVLTSHHLDLYYMARRAWKAELPDVKLQTVERHKLGVHRDDDMPGSEAPVAFLDWIRDGSGPVDRVFEHNRLDVLTLVTLLAALGS
jgi:uncharacterized protein